MRRRLPIISLLFSAALALAQTDAPPERASALAPDELPPLPTETPRPRGTLTLQIAGNSAFPEARLRTAIARQIQAIEEYGLDPANSYDAAFFVDSFYRQNGYSQVDTVDKITGPWQLLLTINEGPLTLLGPINVTGSKAYDVETISKYLLGPTRERFPRIREEIRLPYVAADVENGVGLVRRLYASEGYLDAVVDDPVIDFNAEQTVATISLSIKEGIQYTFGPIQILGPLVIPRDTIMGLIAQDTQNIYTDGRLAAAQRRIEDYLKAQGYFNATVVADSDITNAPGGKVPATFKLEPGLKYVFDGVDVQGNSGVRSTFIQKRLAGLHGQTYSPKAVDRQFRTLVGTGLFRSVRINPEPIPGTNQLRVDVVVEEAKPKEFGIGLGYATFDGGIINLSYTDRNLFGNGRPITIELEATQRGYSGEINYSDPWFLDTDFKLKLRLYAQQRVLKGYSKNEIGFMPSIGRQITDHWEAFAFILHKYVSLYDVDIEPMSLVGKEKYSTSSIGMTQTLDYRNNAVLPTKGYILTGTVDFAPEGISDVSFIRAVGRFSFYQPVTAKSYLSFGARAGIISSLSGQELPIDERFFNGGANTVRSFSELTLGPKDDAGYPLGGQAFTVFNIEYTFPLVGDLYGAVFWDAGNVITNASNFGLENMRYAIGAGLRYNLPIGAIRFDYGLNPDPKDGEAQGAFHFAIGVAF